MQLYLVESPVDPGVDLAIEPPVDGLVDLFEDSVDSTAISLEMNLHSDLNVM